MNASGKALVLLLASLLAACGGGGGGAGSDDTTNKKPTADAGADQSVDARTGVSLTGSGSDPDGKVSTYAWTQTSGTSVTLAGDDSRTLEFTAPDIAETETLTFKLKVTDNDGSSATDSVDVVVAPVVSLAGKVYDGPIANAVITVTAGDRTYNATADADGVYTLDIGAVDPDAFISIKATGAEGQEHVELLSIAGSFGSLQSAAGDDGVLEAGESGNVNVTNVSTAKAVLMIEANGGAGITDDETLATAESNVSGDDLLYLATVIKLVVDGGHTLPEGVNSTLELVENDDKTEAFVEAVDATDPTAFDSMYEEMINDGNLMTAFSAGTVPPELFTIYVSGNDDRSLTYRVTNRGKTWTFGSNNRGTRSDAENASLPFSWAISDGRIVVTYDAPVTSEGNCSHPDDPSGTLYYCESTTTATTITLVHDGATADTLLLSNAGQTSYPDNLELSQPVPMSGGSTNLGLQKSAAIPFSSEEVPGRWIATTTGRTPPAMSSVMFTLLDSGFLEFEEDGTGTRTATDYAPAEGFTWAVSNGVLNVEYTNGDSITYYRMRRDGDVYDTLALLDRHEGKRHSDAGLMLEVDVARLPLLELEDVPGRYALYEKENDFNIRMDVNGTGANEYFNGTGFDDARPFSWSLRSDYVVEMKYNWNPSTGNSATCIEVNDCHNWMDRLWYPAAYNDATGRVYLLEIQQYYDYDDLAVESKGPLNYYQPTVRYFGRTELGGETAASKTSAPSDKAGHGRMKSVLAMPVIRTR